MKSRKHPTKNMSNVNDVVQVSSELEKVHVIVDGKPARLSIGDKIDIGDGIIRTVLKMQVNEDASIVYALQCPDGLDFALRWFTWPEICYMHQAIAQKPKNGI